MFKDGRERFLLAKNYSGNLKLVLGEFHLMCLMTKHIGHIENAEPILRYSLFCTG